MTAETIASWLLEHGTVPKTVLKPLATKLGVPANHVGAALFAGQLVYENQETIVTYAGKGGLTVGEFLHERARERYGPDHPLTEYLGENVDAITEAFDGTEREARTFAAFYRQYRAAERDHRLTGRLNGDARAALRSVATALPGRDSIPAGASLPGVRSLPGFGSDVDPEDVTEIPVTDPR